MRRGDECLVERAPREDWDALVEDTAEVVEAPGANRGERGQALRFVGVDERLLHATQSHGRRARYATTCASPHMARASSVSGSKSGFTRRKRSCRSTHSWYGEGLPQNQ